MPDEKSLLQEKMVSKEENPDPDYQRLLDAYVDNPFFDMILKPEEKKAQEKAQQEDEAKVV